MAKNKRKRSTYGDMARALERAIERIPDTFGYGEITTEYLRNRSGLPSTHITTYLNRGVGGMKKVRRGVWKRTRAKRAGVGG